MILFGDESGYAVQDVQNCLFSVFRHSQALEHLPTIASLIRIHLFGYDEDQFHSLRCALSSLGGVSRCQDVGNGMAAKAVGCSG
ncbi:MAG TPA: hypothetical protein DDY14_10090 [Chromatiaceae bacterium]|jgi:hypothetical protein|nr:MAG: hypothetical protein N838_08195 [Thiohalocapsa sp. PB-PSB1]HBG95647.1 hypothetical protein [Chromatiaceae bacterium]HCS91474.1 hypothetical protein [Chromatiaceae bacterium]